MGYSSVFLHNSLDMWRRQRAASKHCTLPTHAHTHNGEESGVKNLEEVGQRKKAKKLDVAIRRQGQIHSYLLFTLQLSL